MAVRQYMLCYLIKDSIERGSTILYLTHIFYGVDERETHLHCLTNKGKYGWQGEIKN